MSYNLQNPHMEYSRYQQHCLAVDGPYLSITLTAFMQLCASLCYGTTFIQI